MCKIAIHTAHDPAKLADLILSSWKIMSTSEKDGFGACWIRPDGKLGYVKSSTTTLKSNLPAFIRGFQDGGICESNGTYLMIHGRTATCGVNAENTHPMIVGNDALIHNGIVTSKRYHNVETTCDSELLLHAWRDGIKAIEQDINGYYAFGNIRINKRKTILDIVKDDRAQLHGASTTVSGEEGFIFATTGELTKTKDSEYLGEVEPNIWIRFVNGKHVSTNYFEPAKVEQTVKTVELANKSMPGTAYNKMADWPAKPDSTNWRRPNMQLFDSTGY